MGQCDTRLLLIRICGDIKKFKEPSGGSGCARLHWSQVEGLAVREYTGAKWRVWMCVTTQEPSGGSGCA